MITLALAGSIMTYGIIKTIAVCLVIAVILVGSMVAIIIAAGRPLSDLTDFFVAIWVMVRSAWRGNQDS